MDEKVRVLLVEDFPPDAELAEIEIRRSVPNCEFKLVQTQKNFLDALVHFNPHVIVSDYTMPQFDGITALKLTLEKTNLIPFILFTGSTNEDTAVECMKIGAMDYIIKDHIKRLGGSVRNALEKRDMLIEKQKAEEITKQNLARMQSLLEITQVKTETIQDLLEKALNEIVKLTRSKIGYIYRYDEEEKKFELNSRSKGVLVECKLDNTQPIYELENTGIWGEVVRQRKPIVINDFLAPHPLKKGYPEGHITLKRFLTIPIFTDERIVAVAGVGNKDSDYDQADINQFTLTMDFVWKMVNQKGTDAELQENEEKYKAVMNQSIDNIYLADTESMRILEANPSICNFLGYDLEEIKRLKVSDIADHPAKNIRDLAKVLREKKKLYLGERNYRKKNGEIVIVEANATILTYQNKEVICVISHDISDRKKTELALSKSKERFRMILNHSPVGIATFDNNGFLTDSNDSFKEIFCLPPSQEVTSFNLFKEDFISLEEREVLGKDEIISLEKTFTIEQLEEIFQSRINRSGRVDLGYTINSVEIDQNNQLFEYLLVIEDITSRKSVERVKDEFVNNVSHEMRTPLTSALESILIMKNHFQENLSTDQKDLLEVSLRNMNRLAKLIQNILDFQKLNSFQIMFNRKPDSINNLIHQISQDLKAFNIKPDMQIKIDLEINLPDVFMDRERISQVFSNLINNAVKHTEKGSITIKTELHENKDKIKVSVIDTGIGIRQEDIKKLFNPFFQVKNTMNHQTGGTGLGLPICKKIVEGHGSDMYVISEENMGSTFYFFLPVVE